MEPFAYFAAHPGEGANFDRAMSDFTSQMAAVVAASYDFSSVRRVVDVGGGNGALTIGILRAHPHLEGIVFDLSSVAERTRARARETGLAERFRAEGGDFFESVPGGADLYLLKHVIHDWNDERAAAILRSCARAMSEEARVLVIEGVYPERIDASPESFAATANDVNMLVSTGGRQRSEAEFRALYAASGLELTRILPTPMPIRLIEGRRA
jgi:SAM-dependent methyltransferase